MLPLIIMAIIAVFLSLLGVSVITYFVPAIGAIIIGLALIFGSKYAPTNEIVNYKGVSLGTQSFIILTGISLVVLSILTISVGSFLNSLFMSASIVSGSVISNSTGIAQQPFPTNTLIVFVGLVLASMFIIKKRK